MRARKPLAPLRRIVGEGFNQHGAEIETLECGHVIHRRQDFVGPTNAYRRRCWKCAKDSTPKEPK